MDWPAAVTCGALYLWTLLTVLLDSGNAVPQASVPVNTRDICRRDAPGTLASKRPGDNGFRIRLSGSNPDTYIPEEAYTITINGTYSNQKLIGFVLVAVPENAQDDSVAMGTFQHFSHGMTKFSERCPHVVTHTYDQPKAGVDILWTAPPAGAGCVTFRATVIEYSDIWYKDDGALTKVVCQQDANTASPLPSPSTQQDCCACGAGKYQMTFKGLWSRQTHPKDWPRHKRLLHWSNIVGASHSNEYAIWQYGDYASKGVKEVCEFGYTRTLEQEMRKHSRDVRTVVKTPGIWWSDPDGLRQTRWARFSVDRRNHLLTMLTMLGPSPDWCVGVTSLNLCLPNCSWAGDMTIDLYPWDAGTDDGPAYMSPNMKSDPQQKITRITNQFPSNKASPFYGPSPIPPLAQLIIHRINPKPGAQTICYGNETDEVDSFDSFQGHHNAGNEEMPMELKKIIMMSSLSEMEKNKITMKGLTIAEKRKIVMMATGLTDMEKSKVNMIFDGLEGNNHDNNHDDSNNMEMLKKAVMMSSLSQMEQEKIFMEGLTAMEREKFVVMSSIPQAEKDKLVMLIRQGGEQQNQHQQQGPGEAEMELKKVVMMTGLTESEKNTLLMGDLNDMEREKLVMMSSITQMEKDKLTMLIRQAAEERNSVPKCAVTNWSDWSECSVTCGVGERIRKRSFRHPMGSEAMCDMDGMQVENCIGVENTCESLQDECAMTAWSDWSPCSVTCGKGITERRRYYLRQEDATKCVRQTQDRSICSAEIEDCQKAMSMKNFTAICALPMDVGPCRGHFERFYFDTDQQKCVKFAYGGCRGNNNRFSTFEECSQMCVFANAVAEESAKVETEEQKSKKKKKRKNRRKKKKNNGADEESETKANKQENANQDEGDTLQRDNEIEKVSCKVSDWSTWSGCTATCGESFKFKRRTIVIAPKAGGKKCPKKLEKKRKCKVPECPTDCVLGPWGDWSPCTKTCGYDSIQERSRQVLHNRRHDGSPCPARIERRYCQLPPCFDNM